MAIRISLAAHLEERVRCLATASGMSVTSYLNELVERGLEDIEDLQLAARTLDAVRAGREITSSLEDVEARLGL